MRPVQIYCTQHSLQFVFGTRIRILLLHKNLQSLNFFSQSFFLNLRTGTQQFGSGSTVCIGLRLDLGQPTAISATTGTRSRPTHPRMSVTILPVLSDLDLEGGEVVLEVNSGGPVGPGLMRNRSGQLL